jgi:hypothetical protein
MASKSKYFSKLWICDFRIFGFRIFGFRVLTTYRLKTYRKPSPLLASESEQIDKCSPLGSAFPVTSHPRDQSQSVLGTSRTCGKMVSR